MTYMHLNCQKCTLIKSLREKIQYYNSEYRKGNSVITDYEYDLLVKKYIKEVNSHLKTKDENIQIPDVTIGKYGMLSINSSYVYSSLRDFFIKVLKYSSIAHIVAEPKIDGISVILKYVHGELKNIFSRNSDTKDQDIGLFAASVLDIPLILQQSINMTVRGELFMKKAVFKKYNDIFASSRNLVAGLFASKKENISIGKEISFLAFELIDGDCSETYHDKRISFVSSFLPTVPILEKYFVDSLSKVDNCIVEINSVMKKYYNYFEYDTDGIVFKVNDIKTQLLMGNTANAPRWSFALKYNNQVVSSEVKAIDIDVSRSGKIIPVISINQVMYGKKKVSKLTVHNVSFCKKKHINVGDVVFFEMKGDASPILLDVMKKTKSDFVFLELCPYCNSKLVFDNVNMFCTNVLCNRRVTKSLLYSFKILDIDVLGEKFVEKLVKCGKTTFVDVFDMNVLDIFAVCGSQKTAAKVFYNIQNAKKNVNGYTLLSAFGIPLVSTNTSYKLKNSFSSISELFNDIILSEGYSRCTACIGVAATNSIKDFVVNNSLLISRALSHFNNQLV